MNQQCAKKYFVHNMKLQLDSLWIRKYSRPPIIQHFVTLPLMRVSWISYQPPMIVNAEKAQTNDKNSRIAQVNVRKASSQRFLLRVEMTSMSG